MILAFRNQTCAKNDTCPICNYNNIQQTNTVCPQCNSDLDCFRIVKNLLNIKKNVYYSVIILLFLSICANIFFMMNSKFDGESKQKYSLQNNYDYLDKSVWLEIEMNMK